jgi:CRISPR-associated endonuclease/helicase Cas3
MTEPEFADAFEKLTGNRPFPWQWKLYEHFAAGKIPPSCTLPTGLGKTLVIAVWLLALATAGTVPRRLVYVVNRRTVVDQSTREAEKLRDRLPDVPAVASALRELCAVPADPPLAISTLRGQFADNREWSRDPARPAVIVGTVDMIGSRLLFGGYGCGFKSRPLHAGLLGQDALLVHDEAHLEPAFQTLIEAIEREQERCGEFGRLRVMALTATPRGGEEPFELTPEEQTPPDVIPDGDEPLSVAWRRLRAKKALTVHPPVADEKQVVPKIVELAREHKDTGSAVLIFVRTVKAVGEVERGLTTGKDKVPADDVAVLTGTIRGKERDELVRDEVFIRFLPPSSRPADVTPREGTVYLICTAAGEVGVDISADHLVCDLTPFDSMAQRFGRVNRYGKRTDTRIDVVHENPSDRKKDDPFDQRRWLTLELLNRLDGDASPLALGKLPLKDRVAAFTPDPITLPTSDILFDAWALTTVRDRLPGRPPVADWLHGVAGWQPPETYVAWREEVERFPPGRFTPEELEEILEDYPLKPHELLRDTTDRVFEHLERLAAAHADQPAWVVAEDRSIRVAKLGELAAGDKNDLRDCTVLLPPTAGGLTRAGMLGTSDPPEKFDVADEWYEDRDRTVRRRQRVWDDDPDPPGMRLVRTIDIATDPDADEREESAEEEAAPARRFWRWYVRPRSADDDGSKTASREQELDPHLTRTAELARRFASGVGLPGPLADAVELAAVWHDKGKHRQVWQQSIGNHDYPRRVLAKSGGTMRPLDLSGYRHEFGSLIQAAKEFEAHPEADVILHLIATHHGRGRPYFPPDEAFDPAATEADAVRAAREVPRRFARLQRRFGRWGLAYLESLLRAADALASAEPGEGTA